MGFIRAAAGSISGEFADQWKEFYTCDSLPSTILIKRASHMASKRSSNKKADTDDITKDSVVSWGETKEKYAYDTYVGTFNHDETHWLLCIWNGEEGNGQVDNDAYSFEGIAGDDTSKMLPEDTTDEFNSVVSFGLSSNMHEEGACARAFILGFNGVESPGMNLSGFFCGFFMAAVSGLVCFAVIKAYNKDQKKPAVQREHEVNTHGQAPRLVRCDSCGGTYVFGETVCPHCNAPGKTVYDGAGAAGGAV